MKKPLIAVLLLAPLPAFAGDLSGQLGASLLVTDGNSQSRSVGAKVHAEYAAKPWKNTFDAGAINVSGSTGQTAERYLASDKQDYSFGEYAYVYAVGEWEKYLFGGVRERTSEAAGVGRHFLAGPEHFLEAELGAGARQTEENVSGIRHSEAIGRAAGKYQWKFADKNSFNETVKCESGASNTRTESVTALNLFIIGSLSAAISYTLRYNTDVPAGAEHLDTETAAALVYDFGKR